MATEGLEERFFEINLDLLCQLDFNGFFKRLNPAWERTLGYRVQAWNLLLYFTLGLVIAFAMQFAGVMLVFNFLVLPAVTGLLVARSMRGIFTAAVVSGLLAALIGFSLSVPFDLPSGPAIIAVSGVIALGAWATRALARS